MKKFLFLLITVLFFISSTAALSCITPPDKYTFHCPEENTCQENFSIASGQMYEGTEITPENKSYENRTARRKAEYVVEKVSNRKLPSAQKALEADKSACPGRVNKHLYPKEAFKQEELKDRTRCYETKIRNMENYYEVTRQPTTEPLLCTKKHRDSMISGGGSTWTGPVNIPQMVAANVIIQMIL